VLALSRLFISHSGKDNVSAIAFKQWLGANGWLDEDVFLDLDAIDAGEHWKEALRKANDRCEAIILLASPDALSSLECLAEVRKAEDYGKEIIVVLLRDLRLDDRRLNPFKERQIVDFSAPPQAHIEAISYRGERHEVRFNGDALARVKDYLVKCGITPDRFAWPPHDKPNADPFPGLSAFTEDDAGIFFGRDSDILRGLDGLRVLRRNGRPRFMVIQAASGAGKSSFLRAGLWPRLARDPDFAPIAILRPAQGIVTSPQGLCHMLAVRLSRPDRPVTPGDLHAKLMAQDASAAAAEFANLTAAAAARAHEERCVGDADARAPALVLAIDQAEELFAAEDAPESERFLFLLTSLMREPPTGVEPFAVLTIRADNAAPLFQAIADQKLELPETLPLLPLPQTAYREVILNPIEVIARRGQKLAIEPALADRLVADATGADALPLLAFTLSHLYQNFSTGGRITLAQYEAMGGVAGSIDMALKQALARPGDEPAIPAEKEEQFAVLRKAFIPWLARIDPDTGTPMRRVARLDEFHGASRAMVERLIKARLLVADRRASIDVIEVAHESLLRRWPALTSWLETAAAHLKLIEGLDRAAGEWARNGRHDAWLDHRAERLAAAEQLAASEDYCERFGSEATAYLGACRAHEEIQRQENEAALAREQERLAEIARAQEHVAAEQAHTARLQQSARWMLAAIAVTVIAGIVAGVWQHRNNLAQKRDLDREQVNLLAEVADAELLSSNFDSALRLAIEDVHLDTLDSSAAASSPTPSSPALAELAAAFFQSGWRLNLSGHDGGVWSAAFSSDGTRVVTASYDKTARIWDAVTGKQLLSLNGHTDWVMSAAFSSDGTRVVTASQDGTARIWDAASGKQLTVLSGHSGGVVSAAFSFDGARIVTASYDKTARIWDAATGNQLATLSGHTGGVLKAAFSHDGTQIVTASQDATARIWDAATAKQISILNGHNAGVWDAAFSLDGKRIVTASEDATARIWDVATATQLVVLAGHEDWILTAAFNSSGKRVVTASQDGSARLWNATNGSIIATLQGHEGGVLSAAFSDDGSQIVTASFDSTARLWDTATGNEIRVLHGHTAAVWNASYNPDGTRILTASEDKTARIWDTSTGKQIGELTGHQGWVLWASYSPDGTRIVTASGDGTARIWDSATFKQLAVLTGHQGAVLCATFSADGTKIVTASYDNTARIWNAATSEQIAVLSGHQGGLLSAHFSFDGTRVVTSSYDETARIWDVATATQLMVLRGHEGGVWEANFSPDGKRIVTGSEDRTARIWDAASGSEIAILRGHEDWVWSASFNSDGSRIVTASQDHTVRIWDAATAIEIAVLRDLESGVFFAAFNAKGTQIVTGDEQGNARIWDANVVETPAKDLAAEVCTHRLGNLTKLTTDEMKLAGYPDSTPPIDVCAR
jgi:WD40 repeat protein